MNAKSVSKVGALSEKWEVKREKTISVWISEWWVDHIGKDIFFHVSNTSNLSPRHLGRQREPQSCAMRVTLSALCWGCLKGRRGVQTTRYWNKFSVTIICHYALVAQSFKSAMLIKFYQPCDTSDYCPQYDNFYFRNCLATFYTPTLVFCILLLFCFSSRRFWL